MRTRYLAGFVAMAIMLPMLTGCGGGAFDASRRVEVITREDGSGTRAAFIELFGILVRGDGTRTDTTTKEAVVAKQTEVMLTNVRGDMYAVGYVSLGALGSMVKAVAIDGVLPTAETVKDGTYPVSRPFLIATRGDAAHSALAVDFIAYTLSAEGQAVVAESYIAAEDGAPAYAGTMPSGKLAIAGSSSVTPVMEKLREAYLRLNPNAAIELQETDSSSGLR
ncbi:MAG: substrate-binding domain-containing protein, partial [Oscillospiraceae bacterium]|nr:substrate-binding domain-containing protein [Oscillospiraceae bacterium]